MIQTETALPWTVREVRRLLLTGLHERDEAERRFPLNGPDGRLHHA